MAKTPKQLDAEIAASLVGGGKRSRKKPRGLLDKRAEADKQEQRRVRNVAAMMADLTGDDDWDAVDLDQLASWLDLGPSWAPTTFTTRELCEQLLEQSVEPHHAGGPSKHEE